jgi:hypothetical protein
MLAHIGSAKDAGVAAASRGSRPHDLPRLSMNAIIEEETA